jgi:hypothetical protein
MNRLLLLALLCGGCFVDEPPVDKVSDDSAEDESGSSDGSSSDESSTGDADCLAAYNACEPSCDVDSGACSGPWDQCRAEYLACDPALAADHQECIDAIPDCYGDCPPCSDVAGCTVRNTCLNECDRDCEIAEPTG